MIIEVDKIKIKIQYKKIKNINLKITGKGEVFVSSPENLSIKKILEFIEEKKKWILKHLIKIKNQPIYSQNYNDGDKILLWGKEYIFKKLLIINSKIKNKTILIKDNFIILYCNKELDLESRRKLIENWYKKLLKEEIEKKLKFWQEKTGLYCSSWHIKKMKTRWGTCNTKDKRIWFNLYLVKKDKDCLNYIIVHELGHILIKGHGIKFKSYMNKNFPDWKRVKNKLNLINIENL